MRILHIIGSLSPADGGPPESVRQFARASTRQGHDIAVLCQDDPAEPYLKDLGFPVHAVGRGHLGRFGLSYRLWQWLREHTGQFDGLVIHGLWTFSNIVARLAALRSQTPYAVFPHGGLDPWFGGKYPLKHAKKVAYWPLQYPVLRDARAVLFTTSIEQSLAQKSFKRNQWTAVVVPFGTGAPDGNPETQKKEFYQAFPNLRNRAFLLFLSRIHEKKGCDLLLSAFSRIAASSPEMDLVMAGPDQTGLQAGLQQITEEAGIADRVHWPGILTGDVKWGALRNCDAFILPSHQENFGIAVVEALAAGRPVLISNQVNIWPELQKDGVALVEPDTVEGTESLLRRWASLTLVEREEMAQRAEPCFLARYTIDGAAEQIVELLTTAAKSDPA